MTSGFIHEPCLNKWWINKWDNSASASELAEKKEKSEHGGSEHGHGGKAHGGHVKLEGEGEAEGKGGFHPKYFKFFLDVMQLFNCFYMGWYLSQMIFLCIRRHEWAYFFFIPLPSLIMQFIIAPLLFMNYSILLSVGDAREEEVYEEVVSYMEKEEELVLQVREKLLKVDNIVDRMYEKFDVDNSNSLDGQEFKQALAFFDIHFGYHDFVKVMRVVDPDQSDEINKDELQEFLESGQVMERAVRSALGDVDLERMFIDFKQQAGNMDSNTELSLDQIEFKRALALKGIHYSHEDYLKFWTVVDADESGTIELEELQAWMDGVVLEPNTNSAAGSPFDSRLTTPIPTSHAL